MCIENAIKEYLQGKMLYFDLKSHRSKLKDIMNIKYQECIKNGIKLDYVNEGTIDWILSLKDSVFKKSIFI